MGVQKNIIVISNDLLDRFPAELDRYQALKIAVGIEQARLIEAAFVLQEANNGPGALEKVAMHAHEISGRMAEVSDYLEDIASKA